mmetsp:Transcript_26386/g.53006  ORF Transcript_26386/g.53006 Transcript_26386/m.53006 type:complete len:162 (-) Transcript_26386:226-711(-)
MGGNFSLDLDIQNCGFASDPSKMRGADGKIDPRWKLGRRPSTLWALDGLPPSTVSNARSLAGQILMDAKRGRSAAIALLLDAEGLTPTQSAVLLGATDLANGNTALMLAAKNGHAECCQLIVERGADVLAKNRHGETAADLAATAEHAEVAAYLAGLKIGS